MVRLELEPLGPIHAVRVYEAAANSTHTALADERPIRHADPFEAVEGQMHHRCPGKLTQRIYELEHEVTRQAELLRVQADTIARLSA